ncbi:type III pantothenate kinase [Mucilaginibacter limnophilus]|uniref:Type III pantothenate kinase n=1 Tax=Mucilaginibacter limnophilus TaxID=1932778 RepID=A0A3S2Y4K0_9SPHI|nr:type III pantothenate kinase [Mucilaginibacter limnophilus]RVU01882.1 type III pantothenate kinase [Mucilaginibacter limnophilus]
MANLVIDIGNTLTKLAVFEHGDLVFDGFYENGEQLTTLISTHQIKQAIYSSVKKETPAWLENLQQTMQVIKFTNSMAAGITNRYVTPQTLGADRIAAVAGARHLYPGESSLVIDVGTTITYDKVDAEGNYYGGSISPGLNMRYKALNNYTAGLPLIDADGAFNREYGDSTETAIRSGVQNGLKYELTGFIESYTKHDTKLNIILTGGDSEFFDTLLKNSIFAPCIKIEPHLVLIGLNAALLQDND